LVITRAYCSRRKKKHTQKKKEDMDKEEREGEREREREREEKCRAALEGLSQKQAYNVTFNYIYLPEMTRPRHFYPAVILTIRV